MILTVISVAVFVMVFVPKAFATDDTWLTNAQMDKKRVKSNHERAYSFALIGDTQYSTQLYPDSLFDMYGWIADNKEKYNIQYVFGLGDITNRDTVYEWENAKSAISQLNGVVSYSLVRGNHDIKTYTAEQNEVYHANKSGTSLSIGESTGGDGFDRYFADTCDYTGQFTKGSAINTWRLFEIYKTKWLIINLDYNPADDVLEWAGDVIEEHSGHKVIITTHAYLDKDGEHLAIGERIWDKLVSRYQNIQLVFCGHINSEQIITARHRGENGNEVTEILVDLQDMDASLCGGGFVTMLYFNGDGSAFEVELLSTTAGMYYKESNQFTVSLLN